MESIANYLLNQSVQITVLFAVIGIAACLLKNKSAHVRYLLWLLVLAKCLLPSLVTVSLAILPNTPEQIQQADFSQNPLPITTLPIEYTANTTYISNFDTTNTTIETPPTFWDKLENLTLIQWGGILWIAGAGIFLLITVFKAHRTNKFLVNNRRPLSITLNNELNELFYEAKNIPNCWYVNGIAQPFVWGLFKGSIYLPSDIEKRTDTAYRQQVIMHEFAHIVRRDPIVNLLQVIAQVIFFFHPIVWITNKIIRAEREKCCDEIAIAKLNASPKDYGKAIVDTIINEYNSTIPIPSMAIAGPIKNIESRIKTIMKPNKKFYQRPTAIALTAILLLAVVAVPTTIALTERQVQSEQLQMQNNSRYDEVKQIYESTLPFGYDFLGNPPDFKWADIDILLQFADDDKIIEYAPTNPISSNLQQKAVKGMVALWYIEAIRQKQRYVATGAEQIQPAGKSFLRFLPFNPYCISTDESSETIRDTKIKASVENYNLALKAYQDWWKEASNMDANAASLIYPLENTGLKWCGEQDWAQHVIGEQNKRQVQPEQLQNNSRYDEVKQVYESNFENGYKFFMNPPDFKLTDIDILLQFADDDEITGNVPSRGLSSYVQMQGIKGMVALWYIEGIRQRQNYIATGAEQIQPRANKLTVFLPLNPFCLEGSNGWGNMEKAEASVEIYNKVLEAYRNWWKKASLMDINEALLIHPLEHTGLKWYGEQDWTQRVIGEQNKQQVSIETRLISVSKDFLEEKGLTDILLNPENNNILRAFVDDKTTEELLRNIASNQSMKILAAPRVTVFDNESGKIDIITNQRYVSGYAESEEFIGPEPIIETIESGIKMSFLPRISNKNTIRLDIDLKITSFDAGTSYAYDENHEYTIPEISTMEMSTSVAVPENQTAVLSRLTNISFDSNNEKNEDDNILLILAKPSIVEHPEETINPSVAISLSQPETDQSDVFEKCSQVLDEYITAVRKNDTQTLNQLFNRLATELNDQDSYWNRDDFLFNAQSLQEYEGLENLKIISILEENRSPKLIETSKVIDPRGISGHLQIHTNGSENLYIDGITFIQDDGKKLALRPQVLADIYIMSVPAGWSYLENFITDRQFKFHHITKEQLEKINETVKSDDKAKILALPKILVNSSQTGSLKIPDNFEMEITPSAKNDRKTFDLDILLKDLGAGMYIPFSTKQTILAEDGLMVYDCSDTQSSEYRGNLIIIRLSTPESESDQNV